MNHSGQNDQNQQRSNPFAEALEQHWSEQLDDDRNDIDMELLAAYAEGRLSKQEREAVEETVATSPAALETLLFFRRALNVGQGANQDEYETDSPPVSGLLPSSEATTSTAAVPPQVHESRPDDASMKKKPRRGVLRSPWVTAATFLFTIGAGLVALKTTQDARRIQNRNRHLIASLEEQSLALAMARKEQVFGVSAGSFNSFAAGTMTPRMVQMALAERGPVARGGLPDEQAEQYREETARAAIRAIREVPEKTDESRRWDRVLEQASVAISAGNYDRAAEFIEQAEEKYGATAAEVMNLRAIYLLARTDEGEATLQEAADALEELTRRHPAFAQGWFNLALLKLRVQGLESSLPTWKEYLAREQSAELRAEVEEMLNGLKGSRF